MFTVRMVARHPNIASVYALEPNETAYPWLARNVAMLQIERRTVCAAVGELTGMGELTSPSYDASDHAKFVVSAEGGATAIVRIDALDAGDSNGGLVLKLDVEGAELSALRGARDTIARAGQAVIVLEAHPRIADRTGIDPVECLRLLHGVRPFEFRVAERPEARLSTDKSVFEQLGVRRTCNMVAVSL